MKVKICGITTVSDASMVAEAGADMIGINFWPHSKRHVSATRADDIVDAARDVNEDILVVGVFVNQSHYEISHFVDRLELDYVQLHGDESAADVGRYGEHAIKAVHLQGPDDVARASDFPCDVLLVDAPSVDYGGSGQQADWSLAHQVASGSGKDVILAGGLTPENVVVAISEVAPWAVDVASGVESGPGIKDAARVKEFIDRAKGQGI
jgi:phosphoribosylanthranilate isomerase